MPAEEPVMELAAVLTAELVTESVAELAVEPVTEPVAFLISLLAYNAFSNFYACLTVRLIYLILAFQPI